MYIYMLMLQQYPPVAQVKIHTVYFSYKILYGIYIYICIGICVVTKSKLHIYIHIYTCLYIYISKIILP